MEFTGLVSKYPTKRQLTDAELALRLDQKICASLNPHYQLCVIKLNSTYLESVDKWFGWKGMISAVSIIVICMFSMLYFGLVHVALTREEVGAVSNEDLLVLIGAAVMIFPVLGVALWALKRESFSYTHYPMRFNRKTRMIHVFRTNGTVLSISWDKVFFTMGHLELWNEWEVRGHVLEPDNTTVSETFALSYIGSLHPSHSVNAGIHSLPAKDFVRAHWEFIRRYMEDGPEAVSEQIQFCMPVDINRETFRGSIERIFANVAGAPFLIYWMLFPICLVVSLFRLFAMFTSKIPQWPDELEANNRVDPSDPYAIRGAADGERIRDFAELRTFK